MTTSGGIVIVGGGLAAARTAEQLRRSEYTGPVTIVSDEDHLPYDRPPLSKEVLRAETDDVTLKPAEFYDENDITVLLGNGARSVDTAAQTLTLADGSELSYDELIIATGLVPKRISSFPDLDGIHVLRSFDESLALRKEAGSARRAVVVGAGFIGCEVAASLRGMGVEVVLVEPQPSPLASVLGEQIGELVARLHRAEGVDVRCGVGVSEVSGNPPGREGRPRRRHRTRRGPRRRRHRVAPRHRMAGRQRHRDRQRRRLRRPTAAPAHRTCGRSETSHPGATALDTKCAWNIGAMSPTRPEAWSPR